MSDLLAQISPAWPFIIAGLIAAPVRMSLVRKGLALMAPIAAFIIWMSVPSGDHTGGVIELGPFVLETFRFDGLSRIWGLVFIIAGFINAIYGLHQKDRIEDVFGLIYAGAALGAVFSGDLLTLFFFWELTAISSVFLIWASRSAVSFKAGLRYLAIQVLSGVLLLTGAVFQVAETGSWAFNEIGLDGPGGIFIFLAFGIKAGFPLLHNWIQDAYPKATIVGTVMLSGFTTKLAIYALARGFAGTEILIWIGMIMTAFPVFFAVIENDLRKVLSYSLNNQLGYMVVGVGVGTELAINGAAAHAFVHIIYKGLLFMSMGAVLMRTGTAKASELGGLYKSMPLTAVCCLIGAAAISAFPLFSGFVAKAMILSALAYEASYHAIYFIPWVVLIFASAGVLEHAGIKVPWFAFFAHDSKRRVREAPANMLIAMLIAAFLCIFLGVNYGVLYDLLPYGPSYEPYTGEHILTQMQLLMAAIFAFAFLVRMKWYPAEMKAENLDTDWIYRRLGDGFFRWLFSVTGRLTASLANLWTTIRTRLGGRMFNAFSPMGALSRDIPSGLLAIWASGLLAIVLIIAYLAP